MSIETDLYEVLAGVCPTVYPTRAPNNDTLPYITFFKLGGQTIDPLANAEADIRRPFFQINVWSATQLEADNLIKQIQTALVTSNRFAARPQGGPLWRGDEDLDLYGSQQDFSIWGAQ